MVDFVKRFQLVGTKRREASSASEMLGQLFGEFGEGPAAVGSRHDRFIVDAAALAIDGLLVFLDQQIEVVVLDFGGGTGSDVGVAFLALALVAKARVQILAVERINQDAVDFLEGVVANFDFVPPQVLVDAKESAGKLHIRKGLVHAPHFAVQKELHRPLQIHFTSEDLARFVSLSG